MRPEDLTGKARDSYRMWHDTFGLSEQSAMNLLRQDGLLPTSDDDRVVSMFRNTFGLGEEGARLAAGGRGPRPVRGTTAQPSAVTVAETLPDNRKRLIENIEGIAREIRWSGSSLCLWNGESREQASLRAAYYKALDVAEDDATKLWVIGVVKSCWPRLTETGPGSTPSSKPASARPSASKPMRG
jgi:hypothetical protein